MSPQNQPLILLIDDETAILQTLKGALTDESYRIETMQVTSFSHGQKALDRIGKLIPDLVLLDIFMPNCNGLQLLTQIKKEYPDQNVIIISGFGTIPIAIEAIQKGAIDFIEKPLNLDEILSKIDFLKSTPQPTSPKTEPISLHEHNIVGQSNLFLELIQQANRLAPHKFPILIYGEHGTGKTTLAHYMHKAGTCVPDTRVPGPFKTIACATIKPKEIDKVFEKTIKSNSPQTIYLKQVDELSPEAQKVLLSLLEQSDDNRIIASSKTSLFHAMQQKKFNISLFAYLNKAPLEVPPLRKRPYDIPLLVNHYLTHYNNKHNKKVILTTQSIRLLRNHQWPGNINELQQVIENIVVHAQDQYVVITPEHLVPILGEKDMQFIEEQSLFRFDSIDQATIEFKKSFLSYLLRKNHYNIEQVSQRLNLTTAELKNQLLELKIRV